jgi:diamine N-acetyltransferase
VTIEIRRATADDADALHEVAAATFPLACPPDATPENIQAFIDEHLTRERFAGYLAEHERVLLLGLVDGVPSGYTMLVFAEPTDPDVAEAITTRPTVELSKLYTLAGSHGSGLGAALVEASVTEARTRGAAAMWLGVNGLNGRANRFYEKQGFVRVGEKRFLVGDRWEDDLVRERVL